MDMIKQNIEDVPKTKSGDIDIAALLAANGITNVDLSQVKIIYTDKGDETSQ